LGNGASDVRTAAARALGALGAAAATPEAIAALIQHLGVCGAAASVLGAFGATAAKPKVVAALTNSNANRLQRVLLADVLGVRFFPAQSRSGRRRTGTLEELSAPPPRPA
jgi:PBS lyase HEAT-like repeat